MSSIARADLFFYSIIILVYLLLYTSKNSNSKDNSTKLFKYVLISLIIINALEGFAWLLEGSEFHFSRTLNYWVNYILLSINILPIVSWVIYLDYKILGNYEGTKKRVKLYVIPLYIMIIMLISNNFTDFVYTISEDNFYSRGFGIYVIAALNYSMIATVYVLSRKYKKNIEGRLLQVIISILALPILASVLQVFFYGATLTWPFFTLSTLMAFITIEKDLMLKDALTQLSSRGQFENILLNKLRTKNCFTLVMIDIDDFKRINDLFGHTSGDETLKTVASILEDSVKRHDVVCRFGGDEFMLLLDSSDKNIGFNIVNRIRESIKTFNDKKAYPYSINMSFGHYFVDSSRKHELKSLYEEVDKLMYIDKDSKKRNGIINMD